MLRGKGFLLKSILKINHTKHEQLVMFIWISMSIDIHRALIQVISLAIMYRSIIMESYKSLFYMSACSTCSTF